MSKHLSLFLPLFFFSCAAYTQYWQQAVHYTIDVRLNTEEKTLDGFEQVVYENHSPDTLTFIWFHLWPNAYKNDQTALSDQLLEARKTDFYFSAPEQRGYINRLHFQVDGVTARTEDHPQHIDIVKVLLPAPLLPGGKATITTPFHVKLPFNFSRGGYERNSFQLTQWYPKPAVYDARGWHPMPYLEQGEFYSTFGRYDVSLTLPKTYVVAATGRLQQDEEKLWMRQQTPDAVAARVKTAEEERIRKKRAAARGSAVRKATLPPPADTATKTLRFVQDSIHDFALFASPDFIVATDTCRLPSGRVIDVASYYTPQHAAVWKHSLQFTKDALRFYSAEVGDYPYPVASVVQGPESFGGGMEYPTITIISPVSNARELDKIIAHEVGHNWFYGILASNEREHPWMDEGINSFYERKYTALKYGPQPQVEELLFQSVAAAKRDQTIRIRAENFTPANYGLVLYYKTARWVELIEQQLGTEGFRAAMQQYYSRWQFKHPQPDDFREVFSYPLGGEADRIFLLLNRKGPLPNQQLKGTRLVTPFRPASFREYLYQPTRKALLLLPAAGFNRYDGLMVGGLLTNYKLPPEKFGFLLAPLYGTGSNRFNGIGRISYTVYPHKAIDKVEGSLAGARFSTNSSPDSNGRRLLEDFYKITPALRLTFRQPFKATTEKWLEARSYGIGERYIKTYVVKSTDSLFYADSLQRSTRYLNQLTFSMNDYRVLYPYGYSLQLQQAKDFYRLNATAHYFFNYAGGGGASVRLFAAKFGYLNRRQAARLATARYQPKLLGVTGEEDYTYSNYFLGRSASYANEGGTADNSGLAAQQIMLRDGAFKLRLDQYQFLQGRSDNWVAAVNLNTTVVRGLPLRLFLDAGTYAEAWEENAPAGRFLFAGGLQLSFFKNAFNIYAPLLYSKAFRDNLKTLPEQNTFFKKLTFSIDLGRLTLRNLTDHQIIL